MTREEFTHRIDGVTTDDIITGFIEYMSLYNLYSNVCPSEDMNISKESATRFGLTFSKSDIAENVYSTFNGARVRIYDVMYNICCIADGNVVHIDFKIDQV